MYKYQRHHNKIIYIENPHSTVVYLDTQGYECQTTGANLQWKKESFVIFIWKNTEVDLKFYTNDVVLFKCIRRIFR